MGGTHLYYVTLLLGLVVVALGAPPNKKGAVVPRFVSSATKGGVSIHGGGQGSAAEGESSAVKVRAGGEWWVKDPPWFLPPPPEWGPMPPTMYTSFFHKPRYPSLSTANYYPLFSRSDEYDAHLPASMSRRAAYTQQQIYDHYVATYRDHTKEMGPVAGDPNSGVSNPTLYGQGIGMDSAGLGAAHGKALSLQYPNNYVPAFSRGGGQGAGRMANPLFTGAFPGGMPAVSFMEADARVHTLRHDSSVFADGRAVTYFASSHVPTYKPADHIDADSDADEDEDEDEEEADQ